MMTKIVPPTTVMGTGEITKHSHIALVFRVEKSSAETLLKEVDKNQEVNNYTLVTC